MAKKKARPAPAVARAPATRRESPPAAVYLESSVLRRFNFELEAAELERLKEDCAALTVPLLTTALSVAEFTEFYRRKVKESVEKANAALDKLSRFASLHREQYSLDRTRLLSGMEQVIVRTFGTRGIEILPTVQFDQARVIEMAVRKEKPFEEEGEKGFRDTVFILTVIDHVRRTARESSVLVVCDDGLIAEAFEEMPEAKALEIEVVSSVAEALERLKVSLAARERIKYEQQIHALQRFLDNQRGAVEVFVGPNVSRFLVGQPVTTLAGNPAFIGSVIRPRLEAIQNPVLGTLPEGANEGVTRVTFTAKVVFTAQLRPIGPTLSTLEVSAYGAPGPGVVRETVRKDLTLQGTVELKRVDGEYRFSNLSGLEIQAPPKVVPGVTSLFSLLSRWQPSEKELSDIFESLKLKAEPEQ